MDRVGIDMCRYDSHEELVGRLRALEAEHPGLAKTGIIGKTVEGRDLFYIKVRKQETHVQCHCTVSVYRWAARARRNCASRLFPALNIPDQPQRPLDGHGRPRRRGGEKGVFPADRDTLTARSQPFLPSFLPSFLSGEANCSCEFMECWKPPPPLPLPPSLFPPSVPPSVSVCPAPFLFHSR